MQPMRIFMPSLRHSGRQIGKSQTNVLQHLNNNKNRPADRLIDIHILEQCDTKLVWGLDGIESSER